MPEFLTSPIFFAALGGFAVMYMFQVMYKGPTEAEQARRVDEYLGRLSDDAIKQIETKITAKDKSGAVDLIREEADIGLLEGKEVMEHLAKAMKTRR